MMDKFGVYREGPSMETGLIEILELRDRCCNARVPLMKTAYILPLGGLRVPYERYKGVSERSLPKHPDWQGKNLNMGLA
jgi:hypothetical protein